MIEWIERLNALGFKLDLELCIDLILQSLLESFSPFIINFNMNKIEATLFKLLNMLKSVEGTMQKDKSSVMVVSRANKKRKAAQTSTKGKEESQG